MKHYIQAGKFKAECLRIMQNVMQTGKEVIVTKRTVPLVKICPVEKKDEPLFGKLEGTVHIHGDILSTGEKWDADTQKDPTT